MISIIYLFFSEIFCSSILFYTYFLNVQTNSLTQMEVLAPGSAPHQNDTFKHLPQPQTRKNEKKFTQSKFDIFFLLMPCSAFYKGNCEKNEKMYTDLPKNIGENFHVH